MRGFAGLTFSLFLVRPSLLNGLRARFLHLTFLFESRLNSPAVDSPRMANRSRPSGLRYIDCSVHREQPRVYPILLKQQHMPKRLNHIKPLLHQQYTNPFIESTKVYSSHKAARLSPIIEYKIE